MVYELHIWGPAFGLPSIDPQCLAAVAYLTQGFSRDQWVLIANSDGLKGELPALTYNGRMINGFENIVSHFSTQDADDHDLDAPLSARERADTSAFSSHLQSHLLPLLDLSLYISTANYTTITRSAWTPLLPFPATYSVPPVRRSLAKQRTQHLGLSGLDVDSINREQAGQHQHASLIPERLRTTVGKPSVTSLVEKDRFKLDALLDGACGPLSRLLGDRKYIFSDTRPSSLDCLGLGYLSLALMPDLPQPWLRDGLRQRYPNLCAFVERGGRDILRGEICGDAALSPSTREEKGLPWQAPLPASGTEKAMGLLTSLLPSLPFSDSKIRSAITQSSTDGPARSPSIPLLLPVAAATAVATVAVIAAYVVFPEVLSLTSPFEQERSLEDMGEAGEMFRGVELGRRRNGSAGDEGGV